MLQVTMPEREFFNEENNEFIIVEETSLTLEHSLVSLSKWESKWCKPFLGKHNKTYEESLDYIRCMTINQNVSAQLYSNIPYDIFIQINEYISAPMSATWFNEKGSTKKNNDIITAEIIYYWMIVFNIPMECQKWHLNKLLTLIRVCDLKSKPAKKMSSSDMLSTRQAINESRKAKLNSKG